jgi:hypothetical protein
MHDGPLFTLHVSHPAVSRFLHQAVESKAVFPSASRGALRGKSGRPAGEPVGFQPRARRVLLDVKAQRAVGILFISGSIGELMR